jgi:hypothetical protein
MHQREVLAAGGGTLTDTLHIAWTVVNGLFTLLAIGFGAAALGVRSRLYSVATMVILGVAGILTSKDAARGLGEPADAVDRCLGAHQHRRLASLGRRAGGCSPASLAGPGGGDREAMTSTPFR